MDTGLERKEEKEEKEEEEEVAEQTPKKVPATSSSSSRTKLPLSTIPSIPLNASPSSSLSSINSTVSPKHTSPHTNPHPPTTSTGPASFPRLIPIPNISNTSSSFPRSLYTRSNKEGNASLSSATPLSAIVRPVDPQSSVKDSDHSSVSSSSSFNDSTSPFNIRSQSQSEISEGKRQASHEILQLLPSTSSDIREKQTSSQQFLLSSHREQENEGEEEEENIKVSTDVSQSRSLETVPGPPSLSNIHFVSSKEQVKMSAVLPKTVPLSAPAAVVTTPSSSTVPLVTHSLSGGSLHPSSPPPPLPVLSAVGSKSTEEKSLQELLRTLAVEELTSAVSSNIINQDNRVPSPVSTASPTPPPPPVGGLECGIVSDESVRQEIEQWKSACEEERERVKELEEQINEHERNKNKIQLEYGEQIKDLRKELLDLRAKVCLTIVC